jgi:hypothetical protein
MITESEWQRKENWSNAKEKTFQLFQNDMEQLKWWDEQSPFLGKKKKKKKSQNKKHC